MDMNRRSYSRSTASRNTKGIFRSFKFGINGLALIALITISSLLLIVNVASQLFLYDKELQSWRALKRQKQGYVLSGPVVLEPSILVYEESAFVPLYTDEWPKSVIRLSDEDVKTVKKPQAKPKVDEIHLLECLVQCEAGIEDLTGMRLVADVVLNRVKSGKFPNTIEGVIMQTGQFSTQNRLGSATISKTAKQAVWMEITDNRLDTVSLYFASNGPVTSKGIYQHGRHYFSY